MKYDLPTIELQAGPTPTASAPESKDVTAEQVQKLGAATTQAGAAMTQIGGQIQDDIDTAMAKDADNALADFSRISLYDPETGYLQTSKKNALDARAGVVKSLQDKTEEISKGLSNDMQRFMFKKAATARMQSTMMSIDGHAANQAKAYRLDTTKARVSSFGQDMVANSYGWNTPGSVYNKNRTFMLAEIGQLAEIEGWSSEEKKQAEREAFSKVASEIVGSMITSERAKEAKEYFNASKKDIDPSLYEEFDRSISGAVARVEGKAAGDMVFAEYTKGLSINASMPEEKMIRAIEGDSSLNEKEKEFGLARIKDLIGRYDAQKSNDARAASNFISSLMTQDENRGQYSKVKTRLEQIGGIDETTRKNLGSMIDSYYHISEDRALAKQSATIERHIQAAIKTEEVLNDYASGKYGKLSGIDFMKQFGGELGANTIAASRVVDKINTKLENPKITMADFDRKIKTMYAIPGLKDTLGLDPYSKDPEQVKKKLLFMNDVLGNMSDAGAAGPGKQITLDQAINISIQKVKVPGKWWGSNDYQQYQIPSLSESEKRDFVIEKLRIAGKPVTERNVSTALRLLNQTTTRSEMPVFDTEESE